MKQQTSPTARSSAEKVTCQAVVPFREQVARACFALSDDSAFEKVAPAGAHASRSGRCPFPSPSRNAVQTPSANPAPACS